MHIASVGLPIIFVYTYYHISSFHRTSRNCLLPLNIILILDFPVYSLAITEKRRTFAAESWFDDRLIWEWGVSPRLSRSCESPFRGASNSH